MFSFQGVGVHYLVMYFFEIKIVGEPHIYREHIPRPLFCNYQYIVQRAYVHFQSLRCILIFMVLCNKDIFTDIVEGTNGHALNMGGISIISLKTFPNEGLKIFAECLCLLPVK